MKLGLAEQHPPHPPTVLVLGEGAVTKQIQKDLESLGLFAILIDELRIPLEQQELPKPSDIDAQDRLSFILETFRNHGPEHTWVHPGVTVWSERHEFEGWARKVGVSAITSPARVLSMCWNHLNLIKTAEKLGIPTLMLSDDPLTSIREIEDQLKRLVGQNQATLPFVLKSAYRMRGGYGQRVIRGLEELSEWVPVWMNQLQDQTGESILFVERYLESARSYVQPFVRFQNGDLNFFPITDASLMVAGKTWIEVCPAQNMDQDLQDRIEAHTRTLADQIGFVGIGMFVFLSDGVEVYLIQAISRIHTGYNLWEKIARTQAVAWQMAALAPSLIPVRPQARARLDAASPICGVHLKIFAEDTYLKLPHPGEVHEVSEKTEWSDLTKDATLMWDVHPGQKVDWRSSGSLGQLTVFSPTWREVLQSARDVMKEIWISGSIQTNERFLSELLGHPWVEESMFYTGFVDEEFIPKQIPSAHWYALMIRAVSEVSAPLKENESWLWMNQRLPALSAAPPIHWNSRMEFITSNGFRGVKGFIHNNGNLEQICVCPVTYQRVIVRIQNWFFSLRRSEKGRPLQLMALTSGRVHSVFFKEGAIVEPKHCVLIVESLQCLISHKLPVKVKLKNLRVKAEDEVTLGQELAELERVID